MGMAKLPYSRLTNPECVTINLLSVSRAAVHSSSSTWSNIQIYPQYPSIRRELLPIIKSPRNNSLSMAVTPPLGFSTGASAALSAHGNRNVQGELAPSADQLGKAAGK